jgi:hypothetical protein
MMGTRVALDVGFNGVTGVLVLDGRVTVREPVTGSQIEVGAGEATVVVPGFAVGNRIRVADAQVNRWWDKAVAQARPMVQTAPSPRIFDVMTARNVAWGQPVGPSGVFSPDVNPIYVWFRHQGLAAGTTITAVWYFTSTATPTKIGEGSVTVTPSSDWGQFNFELAQGKRWPVGDYRVEMLVSGAPVGEARFQVATAPPPSVAGTPTPTPGGLGGLAPETPQPVGIDLTGAWNCDSGGKFYIRQVGNNVWWYGENAPTSPAWSNVAHGVLVGNELRLEWADVPKGRNMFSGNLVLKVESNSRMVAISKTGGFGGSVWSR